MTKLIEYYRERRGAQVVESENGFVAFLFRGQECFLVDIYVSALARKQGESRTLIETMVERAKLQGCTILTATIDVNAVGATDSLHAALHSGFKLHAVGPNCVWLAQEIK